MDDISKNSVAALAIADKLEAALRDSTASSIADAKDFVLGAMSSPDGAMFVLQGIKAMLIWMQKEEGEIEPDSSMAEIWSMLNLCMSDDQRKVFNEFRSGMYSDTSHLRDWVRQTSVATDREIPFSMDFVMDRVCRIPIMVD